MKDLQLIPNPDGSFSLRHGAGQRAITTPTDKAIYGEQGLFALCTRDQLINASVQGPGVANWLTWRGSVHRINSAGIMTHIGRNPNAQDDYSPPATTCGDCETGLYSFCEFQWRFGEYCVDTLPRKVTDVGTRLCEARPIYRMYGDVRDALGNVIFPSGSRIEDDDEWGLVVAAAQQAQIIASQIWAGTGAQVGTHYEMLGLATQVNTGWQDRLEVDCDGADPVVLPFNGTIGSTYSGGSICEYIEAGVRASVWRATSAGLGAIMGDDMAIFTYPDVADQLVWDWECCMAQTCTPGPAGVQVRINAEEQLARRRQQGFINGLYRAGTINVQGMQIGVYGDLYAPVTIDDEAGTVTADVYGLVRRVGGMMVMEGEYQDFSRTIPDRLASQRNAHYGFSDGGRYAIAFKHSSYCYAESLTIKPRVMCYAPPLNFRITDVTASLINRLARPADVYSGRAVPADLTISGGPS